MSSTELERFKRRLREAQGKLTTLTRPLWQLVGLKRLEGEVLGRNGLPIEGLEVLTSYGQRVMTDPEGRFSFGLFGSHISLTLRWRGVELKDWVALELKVGEPTEIKVKWPHLVRGQVLTEGEAGLMGVQVTLNHQYKTQTDLYGAFTFPLLDGELSELDHFIFEIEEERFVHHFRASVAHPPLRLFYYQNHELYHVKNLHRLAPIQSALPERTQHTRWAWRGALVALLLVCLSATLPSQPPPTPPLPSALHLNPALSVRPESPPESPPEPSTPLEPLLSSTEDQGEELELSQEEEPSCGQIEFTYYQYRVPRGMEGFLLSILFGSWQQWKGDLDLLNGISEDHQLQAGQFIKLKLPIHEWRLFTLYPDEGAQELREALGCDEANLQSCLKVIQVWNPHLDVRFLRRGDSLLVNRRFLVEPRWGEDINRRLDQLKRFRGRRRSRPRLKIPRGCTLYPLRPEVAARVKRAQEEERRAREREREARRLERERRREARRLEREARRRKQAKRRRR